MPLSDYQGVHQTTSNSCGAFALAAALAQLGENISDPQAFAQNIYQSTGCLYQNGYTAIYRFSPPVSGTNPPSAMVEIANQYNVQPSQIRVCYNNEADTTFQAIQVTNPPYGSLLEVETNRIAPTHGNVNGPMDYVQLPTYNQVHLLLVNDNTHWIAITKNEMYDPGTGFVGPYTTNLQPTTPLTTIQGNGVTYTFSGLWIILSN